jgi:hypothetical protein
MSGGGQNTTPGGRAFAGLVSDHLAAVERSGAWVWLLELDEEEMLDALAEWFRNQEEVAPGTREHLAFGAALVLYWTDGRVPETP